MSPQSNEPVETTTPESASIDEGKETFELLNEEEPEETLDLDSKAPPKEDGEDESEEEPDELKEIEEELEGPKEEDLELMTPVRRREILAKYPKLFKDFPYLEKAYYRDQQFTEILPTIQDAKVAVHKAQILDNVDRDLSNGDIRSVLAAAKNDGNGEAFLRIADNYLPALRAVDQQAYYHVLGNVIKDTIITMVREGRALGEQGAPLQAAANVLNQFVFGSQNFTPPRTLARQPQPDEINRQQQIQYEDQQRIMGAFESTRETLQTKADNVLKATIDQHIDPNQSMTDYVRGHATQEAHAMLEDLLSRDTRFRGLIDRLWEKAFQQGFDKESSDRIKSAYLSKAKTLLPSVIKKARQNALKGLGRNEPETSTLRSPVSSAPQSGRSTPPTSGKIRKASDIPKGMSTLDVLMKD
jgi:hypothetical protein